MARVTIESVHARHFAGVSKRTGNNYAFDIQEVLLWKDGEKYPRHAEVMLPTEREGVPYAPGEYDAVGDFYVDRNGRLASGFELRTKVASAPKSASS